MRYLGDMWLVTGRLRAVGRKTDAAARLKTDRAVVFEHDGFPSEEVAKEVLLLDWSIQPHTAEVIAIQKCGAEEYRIVVQEPLVDPTMDEGRRRKPGFGEKIEGVPCEHKWGNLLLSNPPQIRCDKCGAIKPASEG